MTVVVKKLLYLVSNADFIAFRQECAIQSYGVGEW
jgi:hypothetical protein